MSFGEKLYPKLLHRPFKAAAKEVSQRRKRVVLIDYFLFAACS
jgi:hypothetical protein